MSNSTKPIDSDWFVQSKRDAALGKELVSILVRYCGERGDNEGAVDTLLRIIRERDECRK